MTNTTATAALAATDVAFHQHLRNQARDVWEAIFAHPFLADLGNGTLAEERFLFFVRQDYLYLQDFARAICLAGAKADNLDTLEMFAASATSVVAVERHLHTSWSARLGLTADDLANGRRAPTTQAYTRHLLAVAHGASLAETVAALLPCYWIYWEVGKLLAKRLPEHPIYAEWIQAYASEGFGERVQLQLALIDRLAGQATPTELTRLEEHFTQSSRYEYLFWDQAYHQRNWSI